MEKELSPVGEIAHRIFTVVKEEYEKAIAKFPRPPSAMSEFDQVRHVHYLDKECKKWEYLPGFKMEGPNPYYSKTTSGFMLEYSYSQPTHLHTVEGKYDIFGMPAMNHGPEAAEMMMRGITERLGLELAAKMKYTTGAFGGQYGPWYFVNKVDDTKLETCVSPQINRTALPDQIKSELQFDYWKSLAGWK